jgi:hypothetical protein
MNMESARFLNLDVDLYSTSNLSPLGDYLENIASVLFSNEIDEGFKITVEPMCGGLGESPKVCTDEMIKIFSELPDHLKELFATCHKRVFDYGFESGIKAPVLLEELSASHLATLASMGFSLMITIYPYSAETSETTTS